MKTFKTQYRYPEDTGSGYWLEIVNPHLFGGGVVIDHVNLPYPPDQEEGCLEALEDSPWRVVNPGSDIAGDEWLVKLRAGWILIDPRLGPVQVTESWAVKKPKDYQI